MCNGQVFGELVEEVNMRFAFTEVTQEIWSPEHGDPAQSSVEKGSSSSSSPFKGKVVGKFVWPFSLQLPDTTELPVDGVNQQFRLPGHMFTRWGRGDIMYRITVKITHSGMLRPDHT